MEETKILDSVMGPAVYDSRIRPAGINGTGETTTGHRSFTIFEMSLSYNCRCRHVCVCQHLCQKLL